MKKVPKISTIYPKLAYINQLMTFAHLPLFTHGYRCLLVFTQIGYKTNN